MLIDEANVLFNLRANKIRTPQVLDIGSEKG